MNVLVSYFLFIWIPMLRVYDHNTYFSIAVRGSTLDVIIWRLFASESDAYGLWLLLIINYSKRHHCEVCEVNNYFSP